MASVITGHYRGEKQVEICHQSSGVKIISDAPVDNFGKGSSFSPTDLVAGALGSCMLTLIAIVGEREELSLTGMHFRVEKHMAAAPARKIARLPLQLHLPSALGSSMREKLERAALTCPVHHSLHPDVQIEVVFMYDVY